MLSARRESRAQRSEHGGSEDGWPRRPCSSLLGHPGMIEPAIDLVKARLAGHYHTSSNVFVLECVVTLTA